MRCVITPPVILAAAAAVALAAGCAAKVPQHNGYATARPWAKAAALELDRDGEAEVDDSVSYPKRQRARWYRVELPAPGELDARLTALMLGRDEAPRLGLEVLDEGYNVLMTSVRDDDDDMDDEPQLSLQLLELDAGTYYLHVYARGRLEAAHYNLRLKHAPGGGSAGASEFPDRVAFVDPLPLVPAVDDAPPPTPTKRKSGGKKVVKKKKKKSEAPDPGVMTVRIVGAVASGGGTRITLAVGASKGVERGWKGQVVSSSGKPLPKGSFTIDTVSSSRSSGTVALPRDAVVKARRARVRP